MHRQDWPAVPEGVCTHTLTLSCTSIQYSPRPRDADRRQYSAFQSEIAETAIPTPSRPNSIQALDMPIYPLVLRQRSTGEKVCSHQAQGTSLCAAGGDTVMSRPCCPIWGAWSGHAIPPTLPRCPDPAAPKFRYCTATFGEPNQKEAKSQERAGPHRTKRLSAPGACLPTSRAACDLTSVPPDHSTDFRSRPHSRPRSAHANANRTPSHGCWASESVARTYLALFLLFHANARFLSAASLKRPLKVTVQNTEYCPGRCADPTLPTALCAR